MQQLGVSAIHPQAPEFFSAAGLFHRPVDLQHAIDTLNSIWGVGARPEWARINEEAVNRAAATPDERIPTGSLMHFELNNIRVMLSHVDSPLVPSKGKLPDHSHYVAITIYAPASEHSRPSSSDESPSGTRADESSAHCADESASPSRPERPEVERRRHAVLAHIILTQLGDALMREPGALGMYRAELGVVQPPAMFEQLAPLLTQGQIPLPLWINIRLQTPDLTVGRTLGMPLFGHLDLEIVQSAHTSESVYAQLANTATYIIGGDHYLLPGQSVSSLEGEQVAITQAVSSLDASPVIQLVY